MTRIACKFGGSSLAEASQFKKVRAIVESDARRSIVVPSAPGKRSSSDAKLTDLLYLCQSSAALGTTPAPALRAPGSFASLTSSHGMFP